MQRIFWVVPGRLAGRPGPRREPWRIEEISGAGFQALLTLADDQGDPLSVRAAGLAHVCVPLPDAIPADAATERACRLALPRAFAFLDAQLTAGRRVLVHCAGGRDRTGLVLAHYLAHTRGLAAEEAIALVRVQRRDALGAEGWEALALRVIRELVPPPARVRPRSGFGARV